MSNVKKIILICIIVFIVGAAIGVVLTRSFSGLLAGAAGILPAISILGTSKRSDSGMDKPDGSLGTGIDEISGAIQEGSKHIGKAKAGNRTAANIIRAAAKPIKVDGDSPGNPGHGNIDDSVN